MLAVAVLFLEGGYISTAINAMEVFRSAGVMWNALSGNRPAPQFLVTSASPGGRPIKPDGPISIAPESSLEDVGRPDLIFVPASGADLQMMVDDGYDIDAVIARNRDVVPWLREQADAGARIAAVCSGVALVAEAGILDRKQGTMHWALADIYARKFPRVDWQPQYLVTDSGGVLCGGGINSASDLSLYIVEKFCGRDVAVETAKALLIEMPRVWQMAFAHLEVSEQHDDATIKRAQDWLHRNATGPILLEDLAAEVGMSTRNFIRRFKNATGVSPLIYLQKLRVATAKRLLEAGAESIQEVSRQAGYEDQIFFRNLFKRHTGLTPGEYRRRFGRRPQL